MSSSALQFAYRDMIEEVTTIANASRHFLARGSLERLRAFARRLGQHQTNGSLDSYDWAIPPEEPIETIESDGAYEQLDRKGLHKTFASVDGSWRIASVRRPKRGGPPTHFELLGPASVKIELWENTSSDVVTRRRLAMWRAEVANEGAPGCFFHVSVLGKEDSLPFPKSLTVPRFLNVLFTPAAALEFTLAELFQTNWERHVSTRPIDFGRWSAIQHQRLKKVLQWHIDALGQTAATSPWTRLKKATPPSDLFVA